VRYALPMAQSAPRMTPAEYLARERTSEEKHVFWDGEVFAIAGASRVHNRIVAALLRDLGVRLLGAPCQPYASDQRIRIPKTQRYVYPDASVTCPPVEMDPVDADTIQNPRVVFEVLSESTEAFDRGEKFAGYRTVPSLDEYVLLSQKEPRVEHFARQGDGSWVLRAFGGNDVVPLPSLGVELSIEALYAGIALDGA